MSSVTLRSKTDVEPERHNEEFVLPGNDFTSFISALYSGGDSRIAADPCNGLNKYLCPRVPAPDLACASSCTASPVSVRGFDSAADAFFNIVGAASRRQRAHRLTSLMEQIKARLLQYFGVSGLARAILCPSGTDAMMTTAMLIAAERPGKPMTAILPSASETGSGVPMAALCRVFDGPDRGTSLTGQQGTMLEIALRSADGSPRCEEEVNDAFAAVTAEVADNVIVYLTHGTKTGLIAPVSPPRGANVIVDACQARIEPETVAAYLRQGWPVVVTGSKFFGGPAFSGAVLFPRTRLSAIGPCKLPPAPSQAARMGTALRWTAALTVIDAFEPLAGGMADYLASQTEFIERAIASNPALMPIVGLRPRGGGWADQSSIFTFGVRDPLVRGRLMSEAELRPLHERLARLGVLLGQPVSLGTFGGLRLAIGAANLLDGPGNNGLTRVFAALEDVTLGDA